MLICRCRPPRTSTWPTPVTLFDLAAQHLVGVLGDVARPARRAVSGDAQDRRRVGVELLDARLLDGLRQQRQHAVDLVAHFLAPRRRCPCRAGTPTNTCETPSDETERSSSIPLMVLTASSILSVISVSICSGAAPGCTVVIDHRREVDLREAVDAEPREREDADDGQREDQHRREDRTADGQGGKPLHGDTFARRHGPVIVVPGTDRYRGATADAVGELRDVRRRHALAGS